jgi:hypothetical protein
VRKAKAREARELGGERRPFFRHTSKAINAGDFCNGQTGSSDDVRRTTAVTS